MMHSAKNAMVLTAFGDQNQYGASRSGYDRQQGIGLPSALFLIVVMSFIVAAINQLNDISAKTYGREWLSQKAFYAAESGAQMAATQILNSDFAPSCTTPSVSLTAAGLANCRYTVTCDQQSFNGLNFYTLTSVGQCGVGRDQATRIIQVRLH